MKYNNQLVTEMTRLCKPCTHATNTRLLPQVAAGCPRARQQMIEGNMSLVIYRVESYIYRCPEIAFLRDDLTSAGMLGVVKAVNRIVNGATVSNVTALLSYWINREILRSITEETMSQPDDETGPPPTPPSVVNAARHDPGYKLVDLRDLIYSCCRTDTERELIRLQEREGLGRQKIGQLLGIPQAAVYRMLKRIEQRFNQKNRP